MAFYPPITPKDAAAKLSAYSRRFLRKPDGMVYHYTTLADLAGILSSEALYCSDYRQLDDDSEFHFGMEILEAQVATRGTELGLTPEQSSRMLEHLANLRRGHFHISIFTTSFCLWPDDLTLWRAYAAQDGVCIGFCLDELRKHAEGLGFVCGAVRYYDAPRFQEWFDEQLREMKDNIQHKEENASSLVVGDENQALASILVNGMKHRNTDRWIAEVSSLVKRPDFSAEQEWRCIYAWLSNPMRAQPRIAVRSSGTRAIPFVELPVKKGASLIKRIIIGPSPRAIQNFHAAAQICREWGLSVELPEHAYLG